MTKIRDKEILIKFGAHLKKLRLECSLSQEALAYQADIPISQVGRIERGEVNTTVSTLFALAKALNILPAKLLAFD